MLVFSVYDKKVAEYMIPFYAPNVVSALRSMSNALHEKSNLTSFPADFAIYKLGEFRKEDGLLVSTAVPEFVEEVSNLMPKGVNNG